jgi:hypothetical protein
MTNTTTTKFRCSETVYSGRSYRGHQCTHNATSWDQPRARLDSTRVETRVGERSEIDILMGVDNREVVIENLPTYGPVQPLPYCGTHSPAKKAAKRAEKDAAEHAAYERKAAAIDSMGSIAKQLAELLGLESYSLGVNANVRYEHGERYLDGIKISAKAAQMIIERLEAALPAE